MAKHCSSPLTVANISEFPGIQRRMIRARRWVMSIVFVLLATVGAITETARPDISRTVNEVELEVVATNAMGQPVTNLSAADITVTENGRPISQFAFSPARNLPLLATFVYDTSESNEKAWQQMKPAIVNFLRRTITDDDRLRIAAFENQLEFDVPAQGILQVRRALSAPAGHQHVTAFNDALVKALRTQAEEFTTPHRAAMIVVSDGEDNYSIHGPLDVLAAAQRAKIAVYTIRRLNKRSWGNGGLILRALATQTGGRDFTVRNTRELERALAVISDELRSCYVLNYSVPRNRTDGEFRTVSITPVQDKRLRIQAQAGYYVPVSADVQGE